MDRFLSTSLGRPAADSMIDSDVSRVGWSIGEKKTNEITMATAFDEPRVSSNNHAIDCDLNPRLPVWADISREGHINDHRWGNSGLPTRDWSIRSMKLWSRKRDFSRGHATASAESPPQSPIKSFENDMETCRWLVNEAVALLQFWSPTGYRSTFQVDDEVPRDQGSCVVGFSSLRERWCVEMDTEGHFPVRWGSCGSTKWTSNL